MMPEPNTRPRLAAGCRLNEKSQASRVLHMPEKALRVSGPSLEIIERCDGQRTVQQIVSELQRLYSKAEPQKVESDILEYLVRLHDQRALDFISAESDKGAETR
jgi:pyrroloquinoline quinone biosynthesis protein D